MLHSPRALLGDPANRRSPFSPPSPAPPAWHPGMGSSLGFAAGVEMLRCRTNGNDEEAGLGAPLSSAMARLGPLALEEAQEAAAPSAQLWEPEWPRAQFAKGNGLRSLGLLASSGPSNYSTRVVYRDKKQMVERAACVIHICPQFRSSVRPRIYGAGCLPWGGLVRVLCSNASSLELSGAPHPGFPLPGPQPWAMWG